MDRKSAERALRYLQEFLQKQQTRVAALVPLLGVEGEDGLAVVEAWRVRLTTETINGDPSHPLNAVQPPLPAHPTNVDLLTRPAMLAWVKAGVPESFVKDTVKACETACGRLSDESNRLAGTVPRDRRSLVELNDLFKTANDSLGLVREWLSHPVGGDRTTADKKPVPPTPDGVVDQEQVAELVNPGMKDVLAIAADRSKTVDQRQRDICAVHPQCLAWDGPRWGKVLRCTPRAATKTDWWITDRPVLLADNK